MSNIFKLPNGGCMYSHEEIATACEVYRLIRSDRKKAKQASKDYANIMWSQLPLYKRWWYQTKSGIFSPDEWWNFYSEYYHKGMSRWKGVGNVVGKYHNYILEGMVAEELCSLESSKRNCYLNPDQIKVLEELTKLRGRLT